MVENPATWNEDTKRISVIMTQVDNHVQAGVCGASAPKRIYDQVVAPLHNEIHILRLLLRAHHVSYGGGECPTCSLALELEKARSKTKQEVCPKCGKDDHTNLGQGVCL